MIYFQPVIWLKIAGKSLHRIGDLGAKLLEFWTFTCSLSVELYKYNNELRQVWLIFYVINIRVHRLGVM